MRVLTRTFALCTTLALYAAIVLNGPSYADDAAVKQLTREAQQAYLAKDYQGAEAKYKAALVQAQKAHPKVQIILLSNLGAAYREAHKFPQAEESFKRAIAIAETSKLERDPTAVTTMQQYANLLRRMKKPMEADAMEVRAMAPSAVAAANVPVPVQPKLELAQDERSSHEQAELIKKLTNNGAKRLNVDEVSIDELKQLLAHDPDNATGWILLGNKYRKIKEWGQAITAYHTALQKDKDKAKPILGIAICYYENGEYQQAAEESKRYISMSPDDPYGYLLLRTCYSNLGDQRSMLENDEIFLEKFPNHESASAISSSLPHLKRDIEKQAAQTTVAVENYQPTEWEQRHCWARAPMPLKVFFIPPEDGFRFESSADSLVSESTAAEMISKAMDSWVQAAQGRLSFVQAASREEANIVVTFTDSTDGMEMESAAGLTTWDTSGRTNRKAKIALLTVDKETGKPCDRASFLNTCLHEFGHALGLEHSASNKDIMYRAMHDSPLVSLSPNDCMRIVKLYSMK